MDFSNSFTFDEFFDDFADSQCQTQDGIDNPVQQQASVEQQQQQQQQQQTELQQQPQQQFQQQSEHEPTIQDIILTIKKTLNDPTAVCESEGESTTYVNQQLQEIQQQINKEPTEVIYESLNNGAAVITLPHTPTNGQVIRVNQPQQQLQQAPTILTWPQVNASGPPQPSCQQDPIVRHVVPQQILRPAPSSNLQQHPSAVVQQHQAVAVQHPPLSALGPQHSSAVVQQHGVLQQLPSTATPQLHQQRQNHNQQPMQRLQQPVFKSRGKVLQRCIAPSSSNGGNVDANTYQHTTGGSGTTSGHVQQDMFYTKDGNKENMVPRSRKRKSSPVEIKFNNIITTQQVQISKCIE